MYPSAGGRPVSHGRRTGTARARATARLLVWSPCSTGKHGKRGGGGAGACTRPHCYPQPQRPCTARAPTAPPPPPHTTTRTPLAAAAAANAVLRASCQLPTWIQFRLWPATSTARAAGVAATCRGGVVHQAMDYLQPRPRASLPASPPPTHPQCAAASTRRVRMPARVGVCDAHLRLQLQRHHGGVHGGQGREAHDEGHGLDVAPGRGKGGVRARPRVVAPEGRGRAAIKERKVRRR